MPEGVGKLRDAARGKFPRIFGFYDRYHTTITALAIITVVAAVAYIGVHQRATETDVTKVKGDVRVIKQQTACSPKKNGQPKNPKQCEENFSTIIHKILTPLQACEFLERGAPLIQIGGKPIPSVKCVAALELSPSQRTISPTATSGQDASPTASTPASPDSSPGASNPSGGSGGGQGKGPQKQPSGGQGGGSDGSTPGSDGGTPPVGSPGAPEGTATGSSPAAAEEGGDTEGEDGGSSSATGPEQIVGGVNETVHEVGELVCYVNAAGLRICLPL